MASRFKENEPTADVLMNSMRSIGYTFESAVADIVDNSISAGATDVRLFFPIDPIDCHISICDNGCGMDSMQLFDAMKYGSEAKREHRDENDLGRFGLGLKSASLSQCRRLTVISKKDMVLSAYTWDLDVIEQQQKWVMVECSEADIGRYKELSYLSAKTSGTIVIWEEFDFIQKSCGNVYAELNKYSDSVAEYLSLIFHRYLNRNGKNKLCITVNHFELTGLDPFLENHNKTNVRRRLEIPVMDSTGVERMIAVQPYILPFVKDLTSEDKRLSGGIENYRTKQGFYIYRNERLIIWGTWYGRHRDELTKYARIRVDIPNTLDDIWDIDIKKQQATIPKTIRQRLTKAVDEAMDIAVKAQKYRGRIEKVDEHVDYIWDRIQQRGDQYTYQINRDSRIFDLLRHSVDDETWSKIDMVLEEIENAIPYQQIYIDKSQNKVDDTISEERKAEIEVKARMLLSMAMAMGNNSRDQIIEKLFSSEPFNKYPELKEKLREA